MADDSVSDISLPEEGVGPHPKRRKMLSRDRSRRRGRDRTRRRSEDDVSPGPPAPAVGGAGAAASSDLLSNRDGGSLKEEVPTLRSSGRKGSFSSDHQATSRVYSSTGDLLGRKKEKRQSFHDPKRKSESPEKRKESSRARERKHASRERFTKEHPRGGDRRRRDSRSPPPGRGGDAAMHRASSVHSSNSGAPGGRHYNNSGGNLERQYSRRDHSPRHQRFPRTDHHNSPGRGGSYRDRGNDNYHRDRGGNNSHRDRDRERDRSRDRERTTVSRANSGRQGQLGEDRFVPANAPASGTSAPNKDKAPDSDSSEMPHVSDVESEGDEAEKARRLAEERKRRREEIQRKHEISSALGTTGVPPENSAEGRAEGGEVEGQRVSQGTPFAIASPSEDQESQESSKEEETHLNVELRNSVTGSLEDLNVYIRNKKKEQEDREDGISKKASPPVDKDDIFANNYQIKVLFRNWKC